jgi:hypothetical protein
LRIANSDTVAAPQRVYQSSTGSDDSAVDTELMSWSPEIESEAPAASTSRYVSVPKIVK